MKTIYLIFTVLILSSCGGNSSKKDMHLVAELDKIETKIILGIEKQLPKEELLDLVNQLEHNSTGFITGKKYGIIEDRFYRPNDSYFGRYNEYYTELRDAYRFLILNDLTIKQRIGGLKNESKKKEKKAQSKVKEKDSGVDENKENKKETEFSENKTELTKSSPSTIENKTNKIKALQRHVGLYINQDDDGGTLMYRIINKNNLYEVVYQDNVTGNVRIENYDVLEFNEKTKKVKIKSQKDQTVEIIYFKSNPKSSAVFDVIDSKNRVYELITSSDLHLRSKNPGQILAFLNKNSFKGTNTWRLPESQELQTMREQLIQNVPFFEDVWCLDQYSKAMSIFNVHEGTHEKDNGKLAQSGQSLPFLAVSDLAYSAILDQELGIRLNEENPLGIKIAYGSFGEFMFSENIADTFNKGALFDTDNWRLPMIKELFQIFQARETLGINFKGLFWSSTIERKFFVQVMDFSTGEVVQIKKYNHMDDSKAGLFLLAE